MKLKDFREYLAQFPEDTIVEVVEVDYGGYGGGVGRVEEFGPDSGSFTDLTNNPHVKPTDPYFNKKYLRLGNA